MTPEQPNKVENLFNLSPESVSEVVEKPGTLRQYGWDLQTLDRAHIEQGEYLELNNGVRKTLRLYEDGTLIVRGSVDEDFLGWAPIDRDFQKYPRVHTLAITEFTTAFTRLYKRILPFLEHAPKQINFHVEIADGKVGDRMLYITPYPINTIAWTFSEDEHSLKKADNAYDGVVAAHELVDDPDRVAFLLLERVFLFFGVPSNRVPYTVDLAGSRKVDIALIVKN